MLIFINQIREKIGVMFGSPETTPGGRALKFYSSCRIDVRRIGPVKEGEEVAGSRVKVKVVKNKVAPPFRVCEFDMMYTGGISREGDLIDLALADKLVEKSGSWFNYGDLRLGQGRENAKQYLRDNPAIADEISAKIIANRSGQRRPGRLERRRSTTARRNDRGRASSDRSGPVMDAARSPSLTSGLSRPCRFKELGEHQFEAGQDGVASERVGLGQDLDAGGRFVDVHDPQPGIHHPDRSDAGLEVLEYLLALVLGAVGRAGDFDGEVGDDIGRIRIQVDPSPLSSGILIADTKAISGRRSRNGSSGMGITKNALDHDLTQSVSLRSQSAWPPDVTRSWPRECSSQASPPAGP